MVTELLPYRSSQSSERERPVCRPQTGAAVCEAPQANTHLQRVNLQLGPKYLQQYPALPPFINMLPTTIVRIHRKPF